jgi:hypothetical protein
MSRAHLLNLTPLSLPRINVQHTSSDRLLQTRQAQSQSVTSMCRSEKINASLRGLHKLTGCTRRSPPTRDGRDAVECDNWGKDPLTNRSILHSDPGTSRYKVNKILQALSLAKNKARSRHTSSATHQPRFFASLTSLLYFLPSHHVDNTAQRPHRSSVLPLAFSCGFPYI